jgi:DNA-binding MarR family transcriptional regulator
MFLHFGIIADTDNSEMESNSQSLEQSSYELLLAFQRMIPALVLLNERVGRKLGMSAIDMQALHILALDPTLQTPSALTTRMEMPASTVTRVLDRLESRGFIRRVNNGSDRRSVLIERNKSSVAAVKSEFDEFAADMAALVIQFDPDEQEAIARFLNKTCDLL